jgi:hypothetical protein
MATRAGDLVELRQIERLRLEMIEAISAALAYPPFFDFRSGALRSRPIDRPKVAEIEQFIGSANFDALARSAPSSADTRQFLERLALRYLEVNPALATSAGRRYLPFLRGQAVKLAADTHRRFASHVNGAERDFGARRQATSWASAKHGGRKLSQDSEHISRVLEAAISSREQSAPRPATRPAPGVISQPGLSTNGFASPPPNIAPFAAPARPRPSGDLADQPTGPLEAYPLLARPHSIAQASLRELPPDLLNLYGDYLSDLEPEAAKQATPPPPARPAASAPPPYPSVSAPQQASPPHAQMSPVAPANPADARGDQLIFWQLRYQLEAYVRLAARSYGLPGHGGDPSMVLDELRRSGFVDEADLRIAEGVFALTDRVTAQGAASTADYRQALMLYLLYHRSHINA